MDEQGSLSSKGESYCKVCGDKASGKHYGVSSCDGCRGFFKRSIRRNLEYVCKENGRCIVDVTRRNQCQACRFKKCLQVNMKRDAVQHERAPRSNHSNLSSHFINLNPRIRSAHGGTLFPGMPLHLQAHSMLDHSVAAPTPLHNQYFQHGLLFPGMLGGYPKPGFFANTLNAHNYTHKQDPPPHFLNENITNKHLVHSIKEDEVTSSEETSVTTKHESHNESRSSHFGSSKSRLELPIMTESCRNEVKPLDVLCLSIFPAENIYENAAKLLFLAVKWARTIPSFLQLSYRDQSILLEECWGELFVLTAAQWALPVDEALLVTNAIASTSRHSALEEDARRLREIVTRLTLLRVDHTEHACLKALVLFKAECRGLCEPSHVELLQDQTHVMLHEYCSQKQSSYKGRFGKLLLALPAVQAVTKRGLEELLFRQTVGDVAIDRLLCEMGKTAHS